MSQSALSASLTLGVQGASRPRRGLSPPEQIARRSDVVAEPPSPDASGPRARSGGSPCLSAACRSAPISNSFIVKRSNFFRAIHSGDADGSAELREHHPKSIDPSVVKLADAQLVLARSYRASSWTRLVHAVRPRGRHLARRRGHDPRAFVTRDPTLIREDVLIRTDSHWGPPMTYAANLGRNDIVRMWTSRKWLLGRGMDPDVWAAIGADGFGGYTALFSTVVSQRNFWVNYGYGQPDEARFTRLLLDRGADPNLRASLRARLEEGHGGGPLREYRDVTPLRLGRAIPRQDCREPRVASASRSQGRRPMTDRRLAQ